MEGQALLSATPDRQEAAPPLAVASEPAHAAAGWRERSLLVVVLAVAAFLHVWLLVNTEVASRDSIGYIRYAWQLGRDPWHEVIPKAEQHPGYPLLILAASYPLRSFLPGPMTSLMQLAAQLVSVVAGVLVVLPTYYLGRELFGRRVAFWASLLFQCLPAASRVLPDGLSESTFLLFAATALWLSARALRTNSAGTFALAGLSSGFAYLTRPEGALIAALVALILLARQAVPMHRRAWATTGRCGVLLILGLAAVAGPFVVVTGRLTTKPTDNDVLRQMLGQATPRDWHSGSIEAPSRTASLGGEPGAFPPSLAVWWMESANKPGTDMDRRLWGLLALVREVTKGFFYVGWVPMLLGLWWSRQAIRANPGAWVLLLLCLALLFLLYRVAALMGYMSERHALLVILCGTYWMTVGLLEIPGRLTALARRFPASSFRSRLLRPWAHPLAPVFLPLVFAVACLPKDLDSLHDNRAGFRAAGQWIAEHSEPIDPVVDPYCWAHYYAGRVFTEHQPSFPSAGHVTVQYVVLEDSDNLHPHLTDVARARRLKEYGKVVYSWTGKRYGKETARVYVYKVPLEYQ